jgi:transposase
MVVQTRRWEFGNVIVHAAKSRPHKTALSQQFMAWNAMAIVARPPYSPDLAPSDFYLFGHIKCLLRGESF